MSPSPFAALLVLLACACSSEPPPLAAKVASMDATRAVIEVTTAPEAEVSVHVTHGARPVTADAQGRAVVEVVLADLLHHQVAAQRWPVEAKVGTQYTRLEVALPMTAAEAMARPTTDGPWLRLQAEELRAGHPADFEWVHGDTRTRVGVLGQAVTLRIATAPGNRVTIDGVAAQVGPDGAGTVELPLPQLWAQPARTTPDITFTLPVSVETAAGVRAETTLAVSAPVSAAALTRVFASVADGQPVRPGTAGGAARGVAVVNKAGDGAVELDFVGAATLGDVAVVAIATPSGPPRQGKVCTGYKRVDGTGGESEVMLMLQDVAVAAFDVRSGAKLGDGTLAAVLTRDCPTYFAQARSPVEAPTPAAVAAWVARLE